MHAYGLKTVKPFKIMIGYDPKEAVTWHVLAHSIMSRSSIPVSITPLAIQNLRGIYMRARDPKQSTDFTYSRFLTPYLSGYEDCLFMDSDMLCLCDIKEIIDLCRMEPYYDAHVVKHDYQPKEGLKFLNQEQTRYPRKNWSSLMFFHGHRMAVRRLTPEYVNTASPMALHQFDWAQDVGEIPREYNHLVGEVVTKTRAKIVHYTLGAPCFRLYQNCEYAEEWFEELGRMTHCDDPILENYGAYLSGRTERSSRHPEPDCVQQSDSERDSEGDPPV